MWSFTKWTQGYVHLPQQINLGLIVFVQSIFYFKSVTGCTKHHTPDLLVKYMYEGRQTVWEHLRGGVVGFFSLVLSGFEPQTTRSGTKYWRLVYNAVGTEIRKDTKICPLNPTTNGVSIKQYISYFTNFISCLPIHIWRVKVQKVFKKSALRLDSMNSNIKKNCKIIQND